MVSPELLSSLGAAAAVFFSTWGAASATSMAGVIAVSSLDLQSFVPVVISGVLALYGMIMGVVLSGVLNDSKVALSETDGYKNLGAGLATGLACWASGSGIAIFLSILSDPYMMKNGGSKIRRFGVMQQPLLGATIAPDGEGEDSPSPPVITKRVMLVLVFLEAMGLYGLIVGLVLAAN